MRVLVAGANGFLGSAVVRALLAEGHEAVALVRNTSALERLAGVEGRVTAVRCHDWQELPGLLRELAPLDAAVNAVVAYGRDAGRVSDVVAANLLFPLQLLEAAIGVGCGAMLTFGTYFQRSRHYGTLQPYIESKRHFPAYARPLARAGHIRVVGLRLEHLYGPGDAADKFVNRLAADCLAGGRIELTPGEQQRDFLHVDDAARACLCILRHARRFRPGYAELEAGSGNAVSIREFAGLVNAACGNRATLEFGALPYRAGEIMRSVAPSARLRRLGWEPVVPLQQGVEELVAHCRRSTDD